MEKIERKKKRGGGEGDKKGLFICRHVAGLYTCLVMPFI